MKTTEIAAEVNASIGKFTVHHKVALLEDWLAVGTLLVREAVTLAEPDNVEIVDVADPLELCEVDDGDDAVTAGVEPELSESVSETVDELVCDVIKDVEDVVAEGEEEDAEAEVL